MRRAETASRLLSTIADHRQLVVHCRRAPYDVYVGRSSAGLPEGVSECPWGNPFSSISAKQQDGFDDLATRTAVYLQWLLTQPELLSRARAELPGKVLGCWCAPRYCHGWVLAAVANCSAADLDEFCACAEGSSEPAPELAVVAQSLATSETRSAKGKGDSRRKGGTATSGNGWGKGKNASPTSSEGKMYPGSVTAAASAGALKGER